MIGAMALAACSTSHTEEVPRAVEPPPPARAAIIAAAAAEHDVTATFPAGLADTLLVNMVTFIHKRPNAAINRDRTDPQFRPYYVDAAGQYRMVYHRLAPDSTHWFYLIRPARSVGGDKRGVGGRFRTNDRLEMVDFEEVFNTPILPVAELEDKGLALFQEMVATGGVRAYAEDRSFIEWPDDRLKYDVKRREWRYAE